MTDQDETVEPTAEETPTPEPKGKIAGVYAIHLTLYNPPGAPTAEPPTLGEIESAIEAAIDLGFDVKASATRTDE